MRKTIPLAFILFVTGIFLWQIPDPKGEEKPAPAQSAPPAAPAHPVSSAHPAPPNSPPQGLISANGFSCSTLEGQVQCEGKFEEANKDMVVGARGSGGLVLRATKGNALYTYSSLNGCLCEIEKDEISCQNAQGKKQKFKGDKRKEESTGFCAIKK